MPNRRGAYGISWPPPHNALPSSWPGTPEKAHYLRLPVGKRLVRLHNPNGGKWSADSFRAGDLPANSRFDHHAPGRGAKVFYAGINLRELVSDHDWELQAATLEVLGTELTGLKATALLGYQVVTLTTTKELHLVDLTGCLVTHLGLGSEITTVNDRDLTQAWARWWHDHLNAQGLYWRSAQQARYEMICLNERVDTTTLKFEPPKNCADPRTLAEVLIAHGRSGGRLGLDADPIIKRALTT